ncbi:MAG TPA: ribosomal protein S18-alanine N-acetyltransferase [Anaerolineae bacterium]|nr:ribosomal protein S18-alanine N-acetyltransferase [Anaerolineae bacterium]
MPERLPYVIEPMTLADIDRVMDIEQLSFSAPWSARAYRFELTENENSVMLVVRQAPAWGGLRRWLRRHNPAEQRPVLGYAGMWLLVDDGHISTIAVHPEWRGRGLGEMLVLALLERARERGARRATLEVRVSNEGAQALYRHVGFDIVSRRRHYYADNNEDAYIMATPAFDQPGFWENLERRRAGLHARLQAQDTAATLDLRR